MPDWQTIQLRDFCRLFEVADRDVRYILEEGCIPKGVDRNPSTGNRREFNRGQAFWLAMVVKLKAVGVKTRLAADAANFVSRALRGVTQNLNWDFPFLPSEGQFDTVHQYFVDIGDHRYIRMVTDANPSRDGLYAFEWQSLKRGRHRPVQFDPFVILRLDLSRIARALALVEGWSVSE